MSPKMLLHQQLLDRFRNIIFCGHGGKSICPALQQKGFLSDQRHTSQKFKMRWLLCNPSGQAETALKTHKRTQKLQSLTGNVTWQAQVGEFS